MDHLRRAALASLVTAGMVCLVPGSGQVAGQAPAAAPLLDILQAERR